MNQYRYRKRYKHSRRFSEGKKKVITIVAVILLVAALAVGGTVAYMVYRPAVPVVNSFSPAEVGVPEIIETFSDGDTVKQNVKVKVGEDGDGSYFVRAAVVITLQDGAGNTVARTPVSGIDYTIDMGTGWTQKSDGYWYYNSAVSAGSTTANLINTCTTENEDYHLVVDILAQTIQSAPTSVAQDQWGFVPGSN